MLPSSGLVCRPLLPTEKEPEVTKPIPDADDFQDPLENYEPRKYDDPLEEALNEQEIGTIRHEPFSTISARIV